MDISQLLARDKFHMKLRNVLEPENFGKLLWFGFITTLFFSVRKVFDTPEATLLGEYSDFTSLSLYLSDLILLGIFAHGLWSKWFTWNISKITQIGLSVIFVLFIVNLGNITPLLVFKTAKFVELLLFLELARQYFSKNPSFIKQISKYFVVLCFSQVIIASLQTFTDRSLGLQLLGEPFLNPNSYGIAKYLAHGTLNLRGYGTFPHPNLLSSFLVMAILVAFSNIFLLSKAKYAIWDAIGITILILGLIVTQSLAAIIALFMGVFAFLMFFLLEKMSISLKYKRILQSLPLILAISLSFWPSFTPRGAILEESLAYRNLYHHVGWNMVSEKPILGQGIGQSVLHMERFSPVHLETWDIQPIHNYYLLAACEGGLVLSGTLILLFIYLYYRLARSTWNMEHQVSRPHHVVMLGILVAFLALMQFDHYFYTLQQTQFLLWLVLGIIAAFTSKKGTEDSRET